jgi:hypothetical protein
MERESKRRKVNTQHMSDFGSWSANTRGECRLLGLGLI